MVRNKVAPAPETAAGHDTPEATGKRLKVIMNLFSRFISSLEQRIDQDDVETRYSAGLRSLRSQVMCRAEKVLTREGDLVQMEKAEQEVRLETCAQKNGHMHLRLRVHHPPAATVQM